MKEQGLSPAAIGASARGDMENFMVASTPGGIEAQEKAGQQELVNSDKLPTRFNCCTQEEFEALGFTFGDEVEGAPIFRHATLPAGWKREAADHDMWSYIVDETGTRRVSIFYKAAFYDRSAHMSLKKQEE